MKTKKIFSAIAVLFLMMSVNALFGQTRATLKGENTYKVSDNSKECGLEVNGKLVVDKKYVDFYTIDGNLFVVYASNGKQGLCDAKGKFIYQCNYHKISVTSDYVVIYEQSDSAPKFYKSANPTVEVKATGTDIRTIANQIASNDPNGFSFDPVAIRQKEATEMAKMLSAEIGGLGAFEIRDNPNGKQDLVVGGKVLFTAKTFVIVSDVELFKTAGSCWFVIVSDRVKGREVYGLFGFWHYMNEGKPFIETEMTIPMEYSYLTLAKEYTNVISATTFSGAIKYFTFMGEPAKLK